jgi:nucleobase:cation symporter-1, NCS1 family
MTNIDGDALQKALEGRLPLLPDERIYSRYASLLWTTAVLSAASYAYLVGSALASFGNTRLSIAGYLVGLILGEIVVVFAAGVPSFRSGVDTIDAAKSSLGTRGSSLLLVTVLATCLGWAYVLVAMTAQGAGALAQIGRSKPLMTGETVVVLCALLLLVAIWFLVRRGPAAMERLSGFCAPGQIAIAVVLFGFLLQKYGADVLWDRSGPSSAATNSIRLTQVAYGVEFGFANALSLLPYLGGLSRMVRHRRHLVGPTVIGSGIFGAWLIATVAALATAAGGVSDPAKWILHLTGPVVGSAIVIFLLIANVGALVVQVYVAGVAAQQVRAIARLHWDWVVTVMLAPGILVAFRTDWLLSHVATWLAYNGAMFVGLAGVMVADFYAVQRQQINTSHLYAQSKSGKYHYVGGVNWIAFAVIGGAAVMYMGLFDPVSLRTNAIFRFAGAGIPCVLIASLGYWVAMRIAARFRREYRPQSANVTSKTLEVGL